MLTIRTLNLFSLCLFMICTSTEYRLVLTDNTTYHHLSYISTSRMVVEIRVRNGCFLKIGHFYRLSIAVPLKMYSNFGQPNVEIGRKMANGQLLFLALLVCCILMHIKFYNVGPEHY